MIYQDMHHLLPSDTACRPEMGGPGLPVEQAPRTKPPTFMRLLDDSSDVGQVPCSITGIRPVQRPCMQGADSLRDASDRARPYARQFGGGAVWPSVFHGKGSDIAASSPRSRCSSHRGAHESRVFRHRLCAAGSRPAAGILLRAGRMAVATGIQPRRRIS